jgi:hypothetical protein
MAVDIIAKTYLGTFAKYGATAIKLVAREYRFGADELGMVKANKTMRIFPNVAVGASIAKINPPMSFPFWKPEDQGGTKGADAAKAAPRVCPVI